MFALLTCTLFTTIYLSMVKLAHRRKLNCRVDVASTFTQKIQKLCLNLFQICHLLKVAIFNDFMLFYTQTLCYFMPFCSELYAIFCHFGENFMLFFAISQWISCYFMPLCSEFYAIFCHFGVNFMVFYAILERILRYFLSFWREFYAISCHFGVNLCYFLPFWSEFYAILCHFGEVMLFSALWPIRRWWFLTQI